jgi:hypothetical protein
MPNQSFAHLSQRYPRIVEEATRFVSHEHLAGMLEGSKGHVGGPLTLSCGVPRNGSSCLSVTGAYWVNTTSTSWAISVGRVRLHTASLRVGRHVLVGYN